MVRSRVPKATLPSAGQTRLCRGASVILSLLLAGHSAVLLRAADTPSAAKSRPLQSSVAGNAPATPASADTLSTEQLERDMWELINQEREDPSHLAETRGHARPLKWDGKLAAVARAHSHDMADRAYVSHFAPEGSFPALRVSQAGISYLSTAENIAKFKDVFRAQAAFMNEPPLGHNHRANILDPDFTHVGIGIVQGSDGMFYITQEFVQQP